MLPYLLAHSFRLCLSLFGHDVCTGSLQLMTFLDLSVSFRDNHLKWGSCAASQSYRATLSGVQDLCMRPSLHATCLKRLNSEGSRLCLYKAGLSKEFFNRLTMLLGGFLAACLLCHLITNLAD